MPLRLLVGCLLIIAVSFCPVLGQQPRIKLTQLTSGLTRPTDLIVLGATEFLVSQTNGQIRLVSDGQVQNTPFLDLSNKIRDPDYEGIFGMTLHPDYANNGYIYVHYSNKSSSSVFSRFTRSVANPDLANPASEVVLLVVPYPNGGHRSGRLAFGRDGYLYLTTGDSSSGARGSVSPADRIAQQLAQNLQDLHGKMLRIDVNSGSPYTIPPGNPYTAPNDGIPDEIYALGMRNPWRWSFDRQTGDFWLGDVGQDGWEELDFTPATALAGSNYGWPCYEGSHLYRTDCDPSRSYQQPLLDYAGYDNNGGQAVSITGGFVYRGAAYADLRGWYVYGDFDTGNYWTLRRNEDGTYNQTLQSVGVASSPVSFGEGPTGELYVLSFFDGVLYQIGTNAIASVQSGNWLNSSTWNCNCLPGKTDAITISVSHTVDLMQPVQIKSLVLGGKLVMTSNGTISFP